MSIELLTKNNENIDQEKIKSDILIPKENVKEQSATIENRDEAIKFIEKLLENKTNSGVLINFIDWDYIKEEVNKSVFVEKHQKGKEILNKDNATEALYVIMEGAVKYSKLSFHQKSVQDHLNVPYEYFGDMAILNNDLSGSKNTVESEEAIVLKISAETLKQALENYKKQIPERLKELNVDLPPEVQNELLEKGKLNLYRKYHSIVTQGFEGKKFAILLEGKAFVLKDSRVISELNAGDIIGDMELLPENSQNEASVLTKDSCIVLEISDYEFQEILDHNESFKNKLLNNARQKQYENQKVEKTEQSEDFDFKYEFKLLEDTNENKLARDTVLGLGYEAMGLIAKSGYENYESFRSETAKELFEFICYNLERQEKDNPKIFVSHGVVHTEHTTRFAETIIDGSSMFRDSIEKKFGKNGLLLLKLVSMFHDIGYPDLGNAPKFKHQEYSANIVKNYLTHEKMKELIDIDKEQYDLFIEAIEHHGSDNPDPIQKNKGRPFVSTTNEKNPLLSVMRIADNLDLIQERLTKMQKDKDFIRIMKGMYYKGRIITDENNLLDDNNPEKLGRDALNEKIKDSMGEIITKSIEVLLRNSMKNENYTQEIDKFSEFEKNLRRIQDIGNWDGYLHFDSVNIAQNVFMYEENMKRKHGKETPVDKRLVVYIEYNKPANELPLELINWQAGRLQKSVDDSMQFVDNNGNQLGLKIKFTFPYPTKKPQRSYSEL